MSAIAGVIPILPLSILSTIFLHEKEKWLDVDKVEQKTVELIRHLKDSGAPVLEIPRAARIHAIGDALDHMLLRNLIEYSGDRYRMVPQNLAILQYYANSIVHWMDRKSDA